MLKNPWVEIGKQDLWAMEAFPVGPGSTSTAVVMLWGSYQSSLQISVFEYWWKNHWTGSMGLNRSSIFWACIFLSIIKGSAVIPRWVCHDAKLWAGLCCSHIHLTAWCPERSGSHGAKSQNESLRRKGVGLTCSHGELRILMFSFSLSIRSRKIWSL